MGHPHLHHVCHADWIASICSKCLTGLIFFCINCQQFGGVHGCVELFTIVVSHSKIDFCISINDVLVDDAGVYIGETHIWIIKLSQVVLMDRLLELVPEALGDRLVGIVDELRRFVGDDKFTSSLGLQVGRNIIGVLTGVAGWLKWIIEVLDIKRVGHHDP